VSPQPNPVAAHTLLRAADVPAMAPRRTSTRSSTTRNSDKAGCLWQLGGTHIPGTKRTFGETSTAEFGPLLFLDYPGPGFTPIHRTDDFRQVLPDNPCRRS
jgi:hypothetical protein